MIKGVSIYFNILASRLFLYHADKFKSTNSNSMPIKDLLRLHIQKKVYPKAFFQAEKM